MVEEENKLKEIETKFYKFLVSKIGIRIIEKGTWHSFFLSDKLSGDISKLKKAIKLYERLKGEKENDKQEE